MTLRLAVVVSHPIQHFAPWHREVARIPGVELKVFFCCDWGVVGYFDPQFQIEVAWDIPLLDGYDHEFLPIRKRPERLGFWEVDNPDVGRALASFRPDVVQVFGYARRTNWRAVRWARRARVPVMMFSDSNLAAPRSMARRAAKYAVVRWFYSYIDGALYVGENNRRYHMHYGLPDDRLFRGVLPIDRERLVASVADFAEARQRVRRKHGIPDDAFVVLFCGKLTANKRPIDVLHASAALQREGLPVWALVVGEGSERAAIEACAQSEGIHRLTMTGFVNQSSIGEYYAASDVLALSSEFESFGLVVSEAASFGVPAVVTESVGCVGEDDAARPGVNALTYPCGDVDALTDALRRLCTEASVYERMSANAVEVSRTQDVVVLAQSLAAGAVRLKELGPR